MEAKKMQVEIDTISAVITAPGSAAVGIIRISGPDALAISEKMFFAASGKKLQDYPSHTMVYGRIKDATGTDIDEVLCVFMQGPRSYTAEDVVEIQCHGGIQSLRKIIALSYFYGAVAAEPGEFTKRAFLNGRIDLVQAESVMDIINSRSEAALKMAIRQQEGYLSRSLKEIRTKLKDVIVHLEAVIDYPEEDIEDVTYPEVEAAIKEAIEKTEKLLSGAHTGKILKEGLRTVIVGRPNVGKSSLMNRLLREERALVSEYAGTTRDVIEEQLLIGGIPILLADTAGIRETDDFVEKLGVERSRDLLEKAELIVIVLDGTSPLTEDDKLILNAAENKNCIVVVNKADSIKDNSVYEEMCARFGNENVLSVSAKTGEGIEKIGNRVKNYVFGNDSVLTEGAFMQNERQIELLRLSAECLREAADAASCRMPYDCMTIDVGRALSYMGEITGETVHEEIINDIFARFCIGK